MKITGILIASLLFVFRVSAQDQSYSGAYWEPVPNRVFHNKGGGGVELTLSVTKAGSGVIELTTFTRHSSQTHTGTWSLAKNDTNTVRFVATGSFVDWRGTINLKKGQVTGMWNNLG